MALQTMKNAWNNSGDALYYGGALGTLAAVVPFVNKYKAVLAGLPWQELTRYAQWPWAAIGLGEAIQVSNDNAQDRASGIKTNWMEKTGRWMRPMNVLSPVYAWASDDNALYSLVIPGAMTVLGHGIERVGRFVREGKEKKYAEV